jgi:hypothetical protein
LKHFHGRKAKGQDGDVAALAEGLGDEAGRFALQGRAII